MAKKNSIIAAAFENGAITLTVTGIGAINLTLAELSDELRERALVHGLVQKISDAAAIPSKDLPADPTDAAQTKFDAMLSVAERLRAGDWSKRSGDGSGPVSGLIFRAYAEWATAAYTKAKKTPPTEAQLRATYDGKTRADQLALRRVPDIAKIMDRMRAERGAAGSGSIDAEALLAELAGLG